MSNAKKCDICGNLYEIYGVDKKNNKYVYNAVEIICLDSNNQYICEKETCDCCPQCMKSIINHINDLRVERNKDNTYEDAKCDTCKYEDKQSRWLPCCKCIVEGRITNSMYVPKENSNE